MNVCIEKLVFGGQGLARHEGRVIFVWNALPGEKVEIEILKEKKGIIEAVATKIIIPSPYRVEPKDAHFLSTSPWQICEYAQENIWKKEVALETYRKIGGDVFIDIDPEIIFPEEQYHYRNKMEFSFTQLQDPSVNSLGGDSDFGELVSSELNVEDNRAVEGGQVGSNSLAFFERGKRDKFPIEKSELAEPIINETAHKILNWINENHIPIRSLKSLIIRSDGQGKAISALFIKDKLRFETYPKTDNNLLGFQLYYSTHKSPASVPTQLLYSTGQDFITIELNATHNPVKLKSGLLSFFQVHILIFSTALKDIAEHIGENNDVVDFYSGVGSIGLPLAHNQKHVTLVDNNEEAIIYATQNITQNNLNNCEAHCILAEKMTDSISPDKIIIVDPPRAGLHEDVVKKLLEHTPPKIIYLSCDLSTQARDIGLLSQKYKISFSQLYNFFPRTPHIEGLIVLEKK